MLSLDELPNDVLLELAEILLCHKESLCKLRLVSRRLNILVKPVLFRRLVMRIRDDRTNVVIPLDDTQGCRIIAAIASGSTDIYEHTRDLLLLTKINSMFMNESNTGLEYKRKVGDKIFDVISRFKNLRSFGYVSNPQENPVSFHGEVIRALGTLPRLEVIDCLRFYRDPPPSFTLGPISNLTGFTGFWMPRAPHFIHEIASLLPRCPTLTRLQLSGIFYKGVTLNDIFREDGKMEKALELRKLLLDGLVFSADAFKLYARHFTHLTSITIAHNRSPSASTDLGEICSILQQSGTCLEHVTSDHPEDLLLFSYLSSYSGLKSLRLISLSGLRESHPEVVNLLYTQVLPRQAGTLEELRLDIYKSDVWGMMPTENQLAGLSKCRKLRTLVAPSAFTFECDLNPRTIWETWLKVGSQLPDLEHLSILLRDERSSTVDNSEMQSWYAAREELMVQYSEEKGVKFTVA